MIDWDITSSETRMKEFFVFKKILQYSWGKIKNSTWKILEIKSKGKLKSTIIREMSKSLRRGQRDEK